MKFKSAISYKARNILTLGIFLSIILGVGGYFILLKYPKKIDYFNVELKKMNQQIKALNGIEQQFDVIQGQIDEEKEKLANLKKQIVPGVTSAETYNYIDKIMSYSGELKLNLMYVGDDAGNGYGYNIFNIKGEGTFHNIYKFLWYLERGPLIYKIKKTNLRVMESRNKETNRTELVIPFDIIIWALYADINDLPPIKRKLRDVNFVSAGNFFYPYITKEIPENDGNLIDVERAELKAVMPGKAFIVDQNGQVNLIEVGSKVYLGYVTRIDPRNNNVEFTINKGGIVERFILKLGFEYDNK